MACACRKPTHLDHQVLLTHQSPHLLGIHIELATTQFAADHPIAVAPFSQGRVERIAVKFGEFVEQRPGRAWAAWPMLPDSIRRAMLALIGAPKHEFAIDWCCNPLGPVPSTPL